MKNQHVFERKVKKVLSRLFVLVVAFCSTLQPVMFAEPALNFDAPQAKPQAEIAVSSVSVGLPGDNKVTSEVIYESGPLSPAQPKDKEVVFVKDPIVDDKDLFPKMAKIVADVLSEHFGVDAKKIEKWIKQERIKVNVDLKAFKIHISIDSSLDLSENFRVLNPIGAPSTPLEIEVDLDYAVTEIKLDRDGKIAVKTQSGLYARSATFILGDDQYRVEFDASENVITRVEDLSTGKISIQKVLAKKHPFGISSVEVLSKGKLGNRKLGFSFGKDGKSISVSITKSNGSEVLALEKIGNTYLVTLIQEISALGKVLSRTTLEYSRGVNPNLVLVRRENEDGTSLSLATSKDGKNFTVTTAFGLKMKTYSKSIQDLLDTMRALEKLNALK